MLTIGGPALISGRSLELVFLAEPAVSPVPISGPTTLCIAMCCLLGKLISSYLFLSWQRFFPSSCVLFSSLLGHIAIPVSTGSSQHFCAIFLVQWSMGVVGREARELVNPCVSTSVPCLCSLNCPAFKRGIMCSLSPGRAFPGKP